MALCSTRHWLGLGLLRARLTLPGHAARGVPRGHANDGRGGAYHARHTLNHTRITVPDRAAVHDLQAQVAALKSRIIDQIGDDSAENTSGDEGIRVVRNEPCHSDVHGAGQYTEKHIFVGRLEVLLATAKLC